MKANEKGFTYPLVLCLLIVFLMFFSLHVERILTERKIAHESAVILQEGFYFLTTAKKVENIFQSEGKIPVRGTFQFQKGKADFKADTPLGNIQKVQFTLHLISGETLIGWGYFNTSSKRLVKWLD